jgi:dolichol-phosphate mannosyltransferase
VIPEISIVAPAFNEEPNIDKFYFAVRAALQGEADPVEIIVVDDGSSDNTAQRVRGLRQNDPFVRLVRLQRNFGNQAALMAGLKAARGRAAITMDCDLQHPPQDLPRMVAAWRKGARVVQMIRRRNPDARLFKRITSTCFDWVLRRLTDVPIAEGVGDFRLVDASITELLLRFSDARPFYRGMVTWFGFPVVYLEYDAQPRAAGTSAIGIRKRLRLSLDGITAVSIHPLRIAILLGFATIFLCLLYAVSVLVSYLRGHSVPGYPTIIFTVVFMGAVQLISLGILGEYIGRIYEQSRRLPSYIVSEEDD